MIVFSRRLNETIVIGQNIAVTIVEIRDDKAHIGIDAPQDVSVHRGEVFEAIQRNVGPAKPPRTGHAEG